MWLATLLPHVSMPLASIHFLRFYNNKDCDTAERMARKNSHSSQLGLPEDADEI